MQRKKIWLVSSFLFFLVMLLIGLLEMQQIMKNKKRIRTFGVVYMTMTNSIYETINEGLRSIIEGNGDRLITLDAVFDQKRQNEEIQDLIREKVDAIFVNPVDWKQIRPALLAAKKSHIPVINIDSPVYDEQLVDCIVTSDNYDAGAQCARTMMQTISAADIVLLEHPGVEAAMERIRGFEETIEGDPNYRIVARGTSFGKIQKAMNYMEKILKEKKKFQVVMSMNDLSVLGAMAALEEGNRLEHTFLYSIDGSDEGKRLVKEGHLFATVAQFPRKMGIIAAMQAYDILENRQLKKEIYIPVQLITKENVNAFDIEDW